MRCNPTITDCLEVRGAPWSCTNGFYVRNDSLFPQNTPHNCNKPLYHHVEAAVFIYNKHIGGRRYSIWYLSTCLCKGCQHQVISTYSGDVIGPEDVTVWRQYKRPVNLTIIKVNHTFCGKLKYALLWSTTW